MAVDLVEPLRGAIARVRDLPLTEVQAGSLLEDLGVDSLAITEIIVDVELQLDREFPVHLLRQLERIDTVQALAIEMQAALAAADHEAGAPSTPPR